jgi:hypothetical protein
MRKNFDIMKFPALRCPACDRRFGVMVGTGIGRLETLPDPFDAICIHCESVSTFRKDAIFDADLAPLGFGPRQTMVSEQ